MTFLTPSNGGHSNPISQPITRTNSIGNLRQSADNATFNSLSRTTQGKVSGSRKDPQREFFEMTVLAYQIRHQKKSPTIMKINRTELYHECIKTKKGFETWPEWIEQRVTKILISDVYNKNKRLRERKKTQLQKRKSTNIELHGDIKFDDNYLK